MPTLPFSATDWRRKVAKEADLLLKNRYYEANPVLTTGEAEQASILDRPKLKRYLRVGTGPIRAIYSQPGTFGDALFVVSGSKWYKVGTDDTITEILSGVAGNGTPSMAATGWVGEFEPVMYMADGTNLWAYILNGFAQWEVTSVVDGTTFSAGGVFYALTSGSVDAGTPDGTSANPWLVNTSLSPYLNLGDAVSASGIPGIQYSTALTEPNPEVSSYGNTSTSLRIRANFEGTEGNSIAITTSASLVQVGTGGTPGVMRVPVPEDDGIISIGYLSGFVIAVVAGPSKRNGRFYWINPGEVSIEPLDFATAEASPDACTGVTVFNDQFWLTGVSKTEVWYFTGDADVPVMRMKGVGFERGSFAGTSCLVKDNLMVTDITGAVFLAGGGMVRVSDPSIEERIRKAMEVSQ